MKASTAALLGLGAAGAGVGGWVAFRKFVRVKTREALVEEYQFDKYLSKADDVEAFAQLITGKPFSLNLPSLDELVVSLVPIWDTTMPDAAFADILENGRTSRYWPAKYKKPVNREVEKKLFRAMRTAANAPEESSTLDTLKTVVVALATD